MADIFWQSNSGGPDPGDDTIINYLTGAGHVVTTGVDSDGPPPNVENDYDLVMVSSNTGGSSTPGADWLNIPIPVMMFQPYAMDEMEMTDSHSDRSSQTDIIIIDAGHPITGGLPLGLVTIVGAPSTFSAESTFGPGIRLIAEGIDGSTVLGLYESGAEGLNGFLHPDKRGFLAVRGNAMTNASANWFLILDGMIDWALGVAVVNKMNVYDGAAFVTGVPNVWDGAAWVPSIPRVYDGAAWVPA